MAEAFGAPARMIAAKRATTATSSEMRRVRSYCLVFIFLSLSLAGNRPEQGAALWSDPCWLPAYTASVRLPSSYRPTAPLEAVHVHPLPVGRWRNDTRMVDEYTEREITLRPGEREPVRLQRSFVLRCLPVRGVTEGEVAWRFSLQEAEPGAERHAFNSLEELLAFLRSEFTPAETEHYPVGES